MRLTERGRAGSRLLGAQVRNVPWTVCVHSRFGRTRETAEIALEQRRLRFAVEPLVDDVDVGDLERASLEDYRAWKRAHARDDPIPNGESLHAAARRYGRALQALLARLERAFLAVTHEIPVRYVLNAAGASADLDSPHSRIANATPYCFGEDQLAGAAGGLATGYRGRR